MSIDPRTLLRTALVAALAFMVAGCASAAGARRLDAPDDAREVTALRFGVDSMLADPKFRSMHWGILVVDPTRGDTLYSRNAGKLFIPASNQKILTGAVALHLLGPSYRWTTTIGTTGALSNGVVHGDVVVSGNGDPSVSDHMMKDAMAPLRALADSLFARGVRRIGGSLARGADVFPDATLGFGWSWDDLDFAYSAGVDELFFNEGFARVAVRGVAAGDFAAARTIPAKSFPRVRVMARTAAAGSVSRRDPRFVRLRQDSSDAGAIVVEGEIAAGDSALLTITFRDHALAYLTALEEALEERGIAVDGGVAARVPTAVTYPLFDVSSPTLREVLPYFEKPSQNQIGELLLRTLGRARTGVGTADSGAAVVSRQLLAWGVGRDGFVVRDGSGLSRHNVVTPETIVKVLVAMRADTSFMVFHDALPIAGVDGTLANRMKGTPAERNVRAKTGTLDMVRSLSGYVTTADGIPLVFAALANNQTVPTREIERVQDSLAARLASLHLRRGR